jgi:magnesium transporter
MDKYKDHLFILLNFPVNMREKEREYDIPKVSQLSIFVGINYLITIHQSEIEPLVQMFQLCKSNEKERETLMGDSPGFLLHSILEALVSDLFHRLSKIEGNLQDLEDEIFDERTKSVKAKEINLLRREIASRRRIAMSLQSRIYEITNEIQKFSKEDIIS